MSVQLLDVRDAAACYAVQAAEQDVPPGYKHTEVGVIPEDWNVKLPGELATFRTGPFGSALHKSDYIVDGIPIINPMHIAEYLQLVLASEKVISEIESASVGSTMVNLNQEVLRKLKIPTPPNKEQLVIATLLSDMDAEIAALKARRDKTRAIKQGMMQELLTGRTRLI